jgi:hypothetical protein
MAIQKLYKGTIPYFNYLFANGKPAIFLDGRFSTDVEDEIKQLDAEVASKHPFIYIDVQESEFDTTKQDPMTLLRDKFRAELLAEQAAASNPARDMGTSLSEKLIGIATTANINAAAAGSSSGGALIAAAPAAPAV